LQTALSNGEANLVQLIAKHLIRVARYDLHGSTFDALVVYNNDDFEHAQTSDKCRAINGSIRSQPEGLPGTFKDSYMMAGLIVASGSPALRT
jgi:Asp-tRNA(Asn)/Glu-tRNA(Gln) amidotransferase A subunit family amidase